MTNIDYVIKYRNYANMSKEQIIELLCPTDIDCKLEQLRGIDCKSSKNCKDCWSIEYR